MTSRVLRTAWRSLRAAGLGIETITIVDRVADTGAAHMASAWHQAFRISPVDIGSAPAQGTFESD